MPSILVYVQRFHTELFANVSGAATLARTKNDLLEGVGCKGFRKTKLQPTAVLGLQHLGPPGSRAFGNPRGGQCPMKAQKGHGVSWSSDKDQKLHDKHLEP